MSDEQELRQGPIEGSSRVLRELLRTPNFKKSIRIILNEMDPENAKLLVRTLMWEDPELFLGLLSSAPSLVNVAVEGTRELSSQMSDFPPALLAGFLTELVRGVDAESVGEATGLMLVLFARINRMEHAELRGATARFWKGVGQGFMRPLSGEDEAASTADVILDSLLPILKYRVEKLGREAGRGGSETSMFVKGLADSIRAIAIDNPEFMKDVVVPLVEAGRDALARAEGGSDDD